MSETNVASANDAKTVKPRAPQVNELISNCKSLILATVNAEGVPNSSYAPFARVANKFYILVSFMAVHTKNLKDQKIASAMFIDDEADTKQIYARNRLTLSVAPSRIERGTKEWQEGIDKLTETHGKILETLVAMDDFILIELSAVKGSYVNGFGSAYFVDENLEVIQHRNDVGHGTGEHK